ncbi:hypothetical protein [Modestobacter caceresii]|uniref:hypothetical protein n=1 Tax=Modestobacter caceresii TaxID=1522368 RepID=UPI00068AB362|nr:hypothetical protein [Modestobacter caceresii]
MNQRLLITATTAGLLGGSMLLGLPAASAHPSSPPGQAKTVQLDASLHELNDSGATGTASAVVRNQLIRSIEVQAHGLSPDAPHAMHIHYGDDARNECPTVADATNTRGDTGISRLSTVDGLPAYGPIVVSLTTTGDTSPASALAVSRFPVSTDGDLDYSRDRIEFTDVAGTGYPGAGGTGTAKQIADAIRDGEGVVVIHGVDYNHNGRYDFASAGASELDPSLPAEATDPAACGVLR